MTPAPASSGPLRVVVVGAGQMGRAWLKTVEASDRVELVGLVDLDAAVAQDAAAEIGRPDLLRGRDVVAVAAAADAQAVINVTVPQAHHPVTTAALFAGMPVLGEKPLASTVAQSLSLTAAAEATGGLFMISQSRRWNPQVFALRDIARRLGRAGSLSTRFYRAPHFGGFREQMAQPLLVDMAIHAFDTARFVLGSEPVSVYCESYNPPWSWYAGDASAAAVFEMSDGARYIFDGSWCSPGQETSWNGEWALHGEFGSASWDGETAPVLDPSHVAESAVVATQLEGIAAALDAFVDAVRTGESPMGEVHENLMSLVMVEAAVRSAETRTRVAIDDVLADGLAQARASERRPEVRAVLEGWTSVRAALRV